MKQFLICITSLLFSFNLYSQCPPSGLTLSSQAQVDSFSINYPGCSDPVSNITVEEAVSGDIKNLNGLSSIEILFGTLLIKSNDSLVNLSGLDSLKVVEMLTIYDNPSLTSLNGLNNLVNVSQKLEIEDNPLLTDLQGLNHLKSVHDFWVWDNNNLVNLAGLDSLSSLNYLYLHNNGSLKNLTGLEGLTTMNILEIELNPKLENLIGLDSLTSINSGLILLYNGSINNFQGLENVNFISNLHVEDNGISDFTGLENLKYTYRGIKISSNLFLNSLSALSNLVSIDTTGGSGNASLRIQYNSNLTSLNGLENIDTTSISHVDITGNDFLTTCEVQSICDYLALQSNTASITSNATGCNTRMEVEASCNPMSISKNDFGALLMAYPNPTTGQLTVDLGERYPEISVTARNMMGQTVLKQSFQQVEMIDVGLDGPNGMYLVEVHSTEGKTAIIKVIKE